MRIVDVLVQSAAAYSLALMVAAVTGVVFFGDKIPTLSLFAVLNYEGDAIRTFVSVRTFGVQILGKVC